MVIVRQPRSFSALLPSPEFCLMACWHPSGLDSKTHLRAPTTICSGFRRSNYRPPLPQGFALSHCLFPFPLIFSFQSQLRSQHPCITGKWSGYVNFLHIFIIPQNDPFLSKKKPQGIALGPLRFNSTCFTRPTGYSSTYRTRSFPRTPPTSSEDGS